MKRLSIFLLFSLFCATTLVAQTVTGLVTDKESGEPIPGVNIFIVENGKTVGVTTDDVGRYNLDLGVGQFVLQFSFIGYQEEAVPVILNKKSTKNIDISLSPSAEMLESVVISAGRFEQELSEVTVSMRVITPDEIEKQDASSITNVLNTLPGVDIIDNQPSIRAGSGWTYGIGSRSLVLIDEMPVLSPDIGDVKWGLLPTEGVSQIEVLKGASSVLYGSSALNGIINIRTEAPTEVPKTSIVFYNGIYLNPKNSDYIWWGKDFKDGSNASVKPFTRNFLYGVRNPIDDGVQFSHSRKLGNFDLTVVGDIYQNEGYRQDNFEERVKAGMGLRYYDQKIKGLNYGLNANGMTTQYSDFFIWRSADSPYEQSPLSNLKTEMNMFYIDPYINYVDTKHNASHQLRTRYMYKSGSVSKNPTKDLDQILEEMDISFEDIEAGIDYIENDLDYVSILQDFNNGDFAALAGELLPVMEAFFPDITPEQVIDLVGWGIQEFGDNDPTPPDMVQAVYADYQFHKSINNANFTVGATYNYVNVNSLMSGLHTSNNIAGFFQYDQRFWDRLNLSLGLRCEYYSVDTLKKESETEVFGVNLPVKPVLRGGLNYEVAEYTFLRASFGQGYRYPSIVEKYIYKDIGGIAAFPSPNLMPESGWNGEVGVMQGYQWGKLRGFIDVAGFMTRYYDMIEFKFGLFNPVTYAPITDLADISFPDVGLGVNFENVNNSRITGIDANINGMMDISPGVDLAFSLGYVFANPIDLDWQEKLAAQDSLSVLEMKEKSNDSKYLKYRQKHTVKGTIDFRYHRVSIGFNALYKSKTLAVDYFMVDERPDSEGSLLQAARAVVFPGLHDYWMSHNTGFFRLDFRFGVQISQKVKVQVLLNNMLNTEYSLRPMDVSAPSKLTFQLIAKF